MGPPGVAEDIAAYEGLVFKTAEMFAQMVGLELDDMRQELRIKVVKARRSYDPSRSSMPEKAYVYACVANFVKTLKRDAARRAGRVHFCHIEDFEPNVVESRWLNLSQEEAFALVEERFTLPSTITEVERHVLVLLISGYEHGEIAVTLETSVWKVAASVKAMREKLADWKPTASPAPVPPPAPPARQRQLLAA